MSDQVEQADVNDENNQVDENAAQNQEEKGSSWPSIWKMLLFYFIITQVISLFK